jgi:hypothetical protein
VVAHKNNSRSEFRQAFSRRLRHALIAVAGAREMRTTAWLADWMRTRGKSVTNAGVRKWLHGLGTPELENLELICRELHLSMDYIVLGIGSPDSRGKAWPFEIARERFEALEGIQRDQVRLAFESEVLACEMDNRSLTDGPGPSAPSAPRPGRPRPRRRSGTP